MTPRPAEREGRAIRHYGTRKKQPAEACQGEGDPHQYTRNTQENNLSPADVMRQRRTNKAESQAKKEAQTLIRANGWETLQAPGAGPAGGRPLTLPTPPGP